MARTFASRTELTPHSRQATRSASFPPSLEARPTEARLKYYQAAPGGYRALAALQAYVDGCGLEPRLIELVKLRASQVNGCAFCVDMHWKDAKALGESDERLYMLNAWHESDLYSERERAALTWTESLTLVAENHAPDSIFEQVRAHFSDRELADLSFAIATINAWNRLAIGFRTPPGRYQSRKASVSQS